MSLSGCEAISGGWRVLTQRQESPAQSPRQHQTLKQGRPGGQGRRPDIQAWQPGWLCPLQGHPWCLLTPTWARPAQTTRPGLFLRATVILRTSQEG